MPFTCKFQLNNGALKTTDKVVFVSFVDKSFGDFHNENVQIAKVLVNDLDAFVYSTCPCFPSTKGSLEKGSIISAETILGYFSADGESIPYDRPYAQIKFA